MIMLVGMILLVLLAHLFVTAFHIERIIKLVVELIEKTEKLYDAVIVLIADRIRKEDANGNNKR